MTDRDKNISGVFETIRVENGIVQFLDEHLTRLSNSVKALKLNIDIDKKQIKNDVLQLISSNKLSTSGIRITVDENISIEAFPLKYTQNDYSNGYKIGILSEKRVKDRHKYRHKTIENREINYAAKRMALAQGYNEALWLNNKEEVCEGIFSNVFIVDSSGTLLTPPSESGLLPGIIRNIILKISPKLGISAEEKVLKMNDILNAEEVFLTNSLMLCMPVIECAGHKIKDAKQSNSATMFNKALISMKI